MGLGVIKRGVDFDKSEPDLDLNKMSDFYLKSFPRTKKVPQPKKVDLGLQKMSPKKATP